MTEIRQRLDAIIRSLKRQPAMERVRFVREYAAENEEMPLCGVLAVVGVTQTTREKGYIGGFLSSSVKGESYGAKAEIRVYAPADENGNGLSEIVGEMLAGLEAADAEHIITEAGASSIEFDPDVNAVFRKLTFQIEFCVCEEEQHV